MSGMHAGGYGRSGQNRERSGNYFPGVIPAEQFETSDGQYLVINATTQRAFERLCEAIGRPELVRDARFTPRKALMENHADIHAIIGAWVALHTLAECQAVFDAAGVPATKVYATSDILADPHYQARQQILTVENPEYGPVLQPGVVPYLTGTPGRVAHGAPALGEHTNDVLTTLLGIDAEAIAGLRARKVI